MALIQIVENKKKSLGIYVHIPFCRSKCEYCDFYSIPGARSRDLMDRYLDAVILHIREAAQGAGYEVDTVYFGGGTPSFFGGRRACEDIRRDRPPLRRQPRRGGLAEANPDSVTLPMLTRLRRAGFNRISIGVQSDDDAQLKALGRPHNYRQAQQAVSLSRRAGFDNVSVDLMFGLPNQSREKWMQTLRNVIDLKADHISCYGLRSSPARSSGRTRTAPTSRTTMRRRICILRRRNARAVRLSPVRDLQFRARRLHLPPQYEILGRRRVSGLRPVRGVGLCRTAVHHRARSGRLYQGA